MSDLTIELQAPVFEVGEYIQLYTVESLSLFYLLFISRFVCTRR